MRRLALTFLVLFAAGAAQAQATFVGQKRAAPGAFAPPGWTARPEQPYGSTLSQPYRPHTIPSAPRSPGVTDGGESFKPFKGSSVYSDRGGVDAYRKPAQPKYSTYGH